MNRLANASIVTKVGIAAFASYTTYALYVSLSANYEISRRAQKLSTTDSAHPAHPGASCDKYSSLTIAGRFENPFEEYRTQTLYEFFLSRVLELFEGSARGGLPSTAAELRSLLPIHTPDMDLIQNNATISDGALPALHDRLTFTWLGQSCAYIQLGPLNILTDPIFSDYLVSPVFGPKRISPSPVPLQDLPVPDYVLVSHNHPDHLDEAVVDQLRNDTTWVVPAGLRPFFGRKGIHNVIELDWWEQAALTKHSTNVEIACTPAMHWSGRNLLDSNQSLWCSFLLLKDGKPVVFHAGDTGYVKDLFKLIAERYGAGVKLAMLPCGQYCPQWHQKPRHINPEECMKIMHDLRAQRVVGVHWGTFVLSSENFLEPQRKFEELAHGAGRENSFFTPPFGKTLVLDTGRDSRDEAAQQVRNGNAVLVR